MSALTVDLSSVSGPVYSGRDRGEALRQKYALDDKEDAVESVEVIIPSSAYTVSSSFFLGLFGPSIQKCGTVDNFERKFRFQAPDFLRPILHAHAGLALQNRNLFG
jgi:hypothetical protein